MTCCGRKNYEDFFIEFGLFFGSIAFICASVMIILIYRDDELRVQNCFIVATASNLLLIFIYIFYCICRHYKRSETKNSHYVRKG
ncbi:MAG: hypothetical protein MHMPM18_000606 [Marteilia pararefringens]